MMSAMNSSPHAWRLGDDTVPSIEQLMVAFDSAFMDSDWAAISQLNDYTRPCIEAAAVASQATSLAAGDSSKAAVKRYETQLRQLLSIYQSLQQQCIIERDAVAQKLQTVQSAHAVSDQYLQHAKP